MGAGVQRKSLYLGLVECQLVNILCACGQVGGDTTTERRELKSRYKFAALMGWEGLIFWRK